MGFEAVEKLEVYRLAEQLADCVWTMARHWDAYSRDTIGKQLARAADSIGANIAEGAGRGSPTQNRRFIRIARGSLLETRYWLRRAFRRNLVSDEQSAAIGPLLDELSPRLNAYLSAVTRKVPTSKHQNIETPNTN